MPTRNFLGTCCRCFRRTRCRYDCFYFCFGSGLTDFLLVASLSLDLEGFIIDSIAIIKTISTSIDEVRRIRLILDRLRFVLSTLITPGLNANVDSICYGILSITPSSAIAGLSRCVFYPCLRVSCDLQLKLQH